MWKQGDLKKQAGKGWVELPACRRRTQPPLHVEGMCEKKQGGSSRQDGVEGVACMLRMAPVQQPSAWNQCITT